MINDAKSLQQSDLKSGDEIDLSLVGASCKASHYQTRCDKVFINLFQVDLSVINNQFPKWIDQLIKGDLVQVKQNSETKQLALYSRMINGGKNNIDYVKIMNAEQLIFIINELCETNNNASCTRLKYIFSILFTDQQSNEIDGWNNLVEYAQENPKHVIALSSTVSEIISKLSILSQDILEKKEQLLFEELDKIQQQPTSIILSFTDNQWLNVSIPGNYSINSYDIHKRILYYQTLLSEASGQTQINGIIDHVINDDNGTIKEIVINPEPRYRVTHYTVAPEILIETILFFIVTIFTLIQLIILLIKMRFNCKRSQQIKIHYSNLQY